MIHSLSSYDLPEDFPRELSYDAVVGYHGHAYDAAVTWYGEEVEPDS